jgi:hypothetical protein
MKRYRAPSKPRTGARPICDGWDDVTSLCSGVYVVMNWVNGRCYVGSSRKLRARMQQHRSDMAAGMSNNGTVRRDLCHMGAGCFVIFPVAILAADHPNASRALMLLEENWISHLRAHEEGLGYNNAIKGWWTPGARFRDTERKYMRRGNYVLLPGVDLYDPIVNATLSTWVPNLNRSE